MVTVGVASSNRPFVDWVVRPSAASAVAIVARHKLFYAALLLVGMIPLVVTAPMPSADWASHLARVWVTDRVLNGDPFWNERYQFQGFFIPNAILDVTVLALIRAGLDLHAAGMAFLVLTYALFILGVCRLAAATGGFNELTIPLAIIVFYNFSLFWGFLNFQFAIALMFYCTGAWIAAEARLGRRLVIAVVGTAAIGFCHVIAAFVFVGMLGCLDLLRFARTFGGRGAVALADATSVMAAATAVALVLLSPASDDELTKTVYIGSPSIFDFLWWKFKIVGRSLLSGQAWSDVALVAGLAIAAAVLAAGARFRLSGPLLVVMAALGALAIAAPSEVGKGSYLDARLPILAIVFALVALQPLWRSPAWRRRAMAALALLIVARTLPLAAAWSRIGENQRLLEAELAKAPPGSTIVAAWGRGTSDIPFYEWWSSPSINIATIAVPHGIYVPTMFALPSQQPLRQRPEWSTRWNRTVWVDTPENFRRYIEKGRGFCPGVTRMLIMFPGPTLGDAKPGRLPGTLHDKFALVDLC